MLSSTTVGGGPKARSQASTSPRGPPEEGGCEGTSGQRGGKKPAPGLLGSQGGARAWAYLSLAKRTLP